MLSKLLGNQVFHSYNTIFTMNAELVLSESRPLYHE